ncbi:MAG: Hpt domain-containing protein, partial [Fulvivirga sp.]|nr:Hpt domain-containing protein [Fulvivirga sp.]
VEGTEVKASKVEETDAAPKSTESLTDLSYLSDVCNGDKAFMKEMIVTFISNTPGAVNEMQKWSYQADWQKVAKIAHRIKPSISFMGLKDLKPIIKNLEEFGKENKNTDQIPALINQLEAKCKTAIKELNTALQNNLEI